MGENIVPLAEGLRQEGVRLLTDIKKIRGGKGTSEYLRGQEDFPEPLERLLRFLSLVGYEQGASSVVPEFGDPCQRLLQCDIRYNNGDLRALDDLAATAQQIVTDPFSVFDPNKVNDSFYDMETGRLADGKK